MPGRSPQEPPLVIAFGDNTFTACFLDYALPYVRSLIFLSAFLSAPPTGCPWSRQPCWLEILSMRVFYHCNYYCKEHLFSVCRPCYIWSSFLTNKKSDSQKWAFLVSGKEVLSVLSDGNSNLENKEKEEKKIYSDIPIFFCCSPTPSVVCTAPKTCTIRRLSI